MVTALVPWPWMLALPLTTVPPLGPACAAKAIRAASATVLASRTRYERDEWGRNEWRLMAGPFSVLGADDEEEAPVVPRPLHGFRCGQVRGYRIPPTETESTPRRRGLLVARCPHIWGQIMEPGIVGEPIELDLCDRLRGPRHGRHVVAQLAKLLDAGIRH